MTRSEIEAAYTIARGRITRHGKFEGAPRYAPYFYDLLLDGGAEDHDADDNPMFAVTAEDCAEFPELRVGWGIKILEDEQGFVTILVAK